MDIRLVKSLLEAKPKTSYFKVEFIILADQRHHQIMQLHCSRSKHDSENF